MNNAVLAIAISDIRPHCKNEPDIIERLKKAMKQAHQFWLDTDDNLRFNAAIMAAYQESPDEEAELIAMNMKFVRTISAAMRGVDVNFDTIKLDKTLPLIGLWHETKKGE